MCYEILVWFRLTEHEIVVTERQEGEILHKRDAPFSHLQWIAHQKIICDSNMCYFLRIRKLFFFLVLPNSVCSCQIADWPLWFISTRSFIHNVARTPPPTPTPFPSVCKAVLQNDTHHSLAVCVYWTNRFRFCLSFSPFFLSQSFFIHIFSFHYLCSFLIFIDLFPIIFFVHWNFSRTQRVFLNYIFSHYFADCITKVTFALILPGLII